jgi:hypothetical protein
MVYIYILKLVDNKYYVGKTKNPDIRIAKHFDNYGAYWTKKYKPIEIVELINDCDDYDEDKYTLKYMEKYGIDNVRGGSFSQIELTEESKKIINKMLKGASDKCFICDEKDHYANKCIKKKIEKYIDSLDGNNNYKISFINKIYEDVLKYESIIAQILRISSDKSKIYELEVKMTKYNILNNELIQINSTHKKELSRKINSTHKKELSRKIDILRQNIDYNLYTTIINLYSKFVEKSSGYEKNVLIQYLELEMFVLNKQAALKKIYEKYENKNIIEKILIELYSRVNENTRRIHDINVE